MHEWKITLAAMSRTNSERVQYGGCRISQVIDDVGIPGLRQGQGMQREGAIDSLILGCPRKDVERQGARGTAQVVM